jgi:hypothetical protein
MSRSAYLVVVLLTGFAFLFHADLCAQTPGRPHVYLTHLKTWLASDGFEQKPDSQSKENTGRSSYAKEFQKECTSVILVDLPNADYALAIDDKKSLSGLTNAKAARFQYEVYSRDLGQVFAGGEDLLTNAIRKSCDAVTAPSPIPLRPGPEQNTSAGSVVSAPPVAQQPLFTDFPSQMICTDSSFVAMTAGVVPAEVVIIRITRRGIEQPERIPLKYHDVYGIKCNSQRVELLVQEDGADNFSRLPFAVREDSVQEEQPIPIGYSISGKGPTPSEIQDFHKAQLLPFGDWRTSVPAVPRFNIMYELHFIRTQERVREGLKTSLVVDLLEEEALDHHVNASVPLINFQRTEYAE